jgi:S-disulfanyl-L-cysteine oxidoreductase SoxD
MYSWANASARGIVGSLALLATLAASATHAANPFEGRQSELGRPATDDEIAAWDIDVRPDFTGLPDGSGSALEGEEIWLQQCASCHGDFADANNFFSPLVLGNITDEDMESGHVAALLDPTRVRTTLMKVPTVSTLWDYIHRAMPWNNPKSLSDDQVYAVLAYLLSLAYIIDEDFVLDQDSILEVQARMPNRNGMTEEHGMWKVDGRPDVENTRCMKNCDTSPRVTSFIPDFARNAHGDLALQNREFGPVRGIKTADGEDGHQQVDLSPVQPQPGQSLADEKGCMACHRLDQKLVGPAFQSVADKYRSRSDKLSYLAAKIRSGGSGIWSGTMPPQAQVAPAEAETIARWISSLAPQ